MPDPGPRQENHGNSQPNETIEWHAKKTGEFRRPGASTRGRDFAVWSERKRHLCRANIHVLLRSGALGCPRWRKRFHPVMDKNQIVFSRQWRYQSRKGDRVQTGTANVSHLGFLRRGRPDLVPSNGMARTKRKRWCLELD